MKLTLWSTISTVTLCLVASQRYALAQVQLESQVQQCQISIQQQSSEPDAILSPQVLLSEEIETMCQLNGQQPRTDDGAIATDSNPSPQNFTAPSLWWQQRQVGELVHSDRLIDSWRAYPDTNTDNDTGTSLAHVDVIVNSQIWRLLNYLERYSLITQFGKSAKSYGYQLRLFADNRLVGLQVCEFSAATVMTGVSAPDAGNLSTATALAEPDITTCAIELNYFGQGTIRGRGSQR
ncbi:MAG: hypothetical protein AAGF93_00850 [Cyanobacteria bacterium P01_H01_bin.105]